MLVVSIAAVLVICAAAIGLAVYQSGVDQRAAKLKARTNAVGRVSELISRAAYHREQLEAEAEELVALHGYRPSSFQATQLSFVIYAGTDYAETIEQLMRYDYPQAQPHSSKGPASDSAHARRPARLK